MLFTLSTIEIIQKIDENSQIWRFLKNSIFFKNFRKNLLFFSTLFWTVFWTTLLILKHGFACKPRKSLPNEAFRPERPDSRLNLKKTELFGFVGRLRQKSSIGSEFRRKRWRWAYVVWYVSDTGILPTLDWKESEAFDVYETMSKTLKVSFIIPLPGHISIIVIQLNFMIFNYCYYSFQKKLGPTLCI